MQVMGDLKIHDLRLISLKQIVDQRGAVFHYLRSDDKNFNGFGEAYYSKVNSGVVKGWKYHKEVCQHFCVPVGEIKIVIYDGRLDSPSLGCVDEILLNDSSNYSRLSIPPRLWYSFKCISETSSLLANIINQVHHPDESETLPIDTEFIPYDWSK